MVEEKLTYSVIGAFFKVHKTLGHGFLEHVYSAALDLELRKRGHVVARQLGVAILYEGVEIAYQRLDMVVDDTIVLEIKASQDLHRDAKRQVYNYLRATRLEVGLLLHFNRAGDFYRLECRNGVNGASPRPISPSVSP